MRVLSLIPAALLLTPASSLPVEARADEACTSPALRQEWSEVSQAVRDSYVSAIFCMTKKPSKLGLDTSLYDDFPYIHNVLDVEIHFVAQFLPWHRYFVRMYERALQECGYTGNALYWDWTKDAADTSKAAIWDAETGVGGNGQPPGDGSSQRCVKDGPFKDLPLSYTENRYEPHCLARNWNNGNQQVGDMLAYAYTPEVVEKINEAADYPSFHDQLETGPHGAIHSAVGGDMSPATSPNDPLFFLHHTQIDRLWWLWQNANSSRTFMFGGNRTQTSKSNPTSPAAKLTDVMSMMGLAEDLPVQDVMDTKTELLCYSY